MYWSLLAWMTFSKFIKLVTHFVRYPVDILLWPVSILFGWFHGGIKYYALFTLDEVSRTHPSFYSVTIVANFKVQTTWGSRAGADADDSDRMIRQQVIQRQQQRQYEYYDEKRDEKLPLNEAFHDDVSYDLRHKPAVAA